MIHIFKCGSRDLGLFPHLKTKWAHNKVDSEGALILTFIITVFQDWMVNDSEQTLQ